MILLAKVALAIRRNSRGSRRIHASRWHRAGSGGRQPWHPRPHLGAGGNRPDGNARAPIAMHFTPKHELHKFPREASKQFPILRVLAKELGNYPNTQNSSTSRDSDTHVVVRTRGHRKSSSTSWIPRQSPRRLPVGDDSGRWSTSLQCKHKQANRRFASDSNATPPPRQPALSHLIMKNAGLLSGVFISSNCFCLSSRFCRTPSDRTASPAR